MSKDNRGLKCVNCNSPIKEKHNLCPGCGLIWSKKFKTQEQIANEEHLLDDQMTDFNPEDVGYKPFEDNKGNILYKVSND